MILHITQKSDWEKARNKNEYTASSLKSEGFIHCSTIEQAADTANLFFKGQTGLVLLCIDENKLSSQLKYEAPSGGGRHDPTVGNLFPHIYGPVNISAVIEVVDFPPNEDGYFVLPGKLESQSDK